MSTPVPHADILEIAARFYALLDADDTEGLLTLFSDDVEIHYPAGDLLPYGGAWHGREGVAAFFDAHDIAEEILAFETGSMFAGANMVLVLGHYRGRAKSSDQEWSTSFVHALTVVDGQIRRLEAFFDSAAAVAAR